MENPAEFLIACTAIFSGLYAVNKAFELLYVLERSAPPDPHAAEVAQRLREEGGLTRRLFAAWYIKSEQKRGQETPLSKAYQKHFDLWDESQKSKFVLEELTTFPTFSYWLYGGRNL